MKSDASYNINLQQIRSFQPKISIITVVYNGEHTLERTIKSVASLCYSNVEYVIVDGGSTDGTLHIIQKYRNVISYIISEPDHGLYDAMNKGMAVSTGDYYWFINSGDEVADSKVLSNIFKNFSPAEIYYGETMIVDLQGLEIGLRRLRPGKELHWKDFSNGMLVSHQSVIVSKRIATDYNLQYRFSADYEWVLAAFRQANITVNTQMVLSRFLEGGITRQNILPGLKERFQIMAQNFGFLATLLHHIPISFKFIYYFVKYKRF